MMTETEEREALEEEAEDRVWGPSPLEQVYVAWYYKDDMEPVPPHDLFDAEFYDWLDW